MNGEVTQTGLELNPIELVKSGRGVCSLPA